MPSNRAMDAGKGRGYGFDSERQRSLSFSDESVRRTFVRKVYMIVMFQLMFAFGVVALFVFNEDVKLYAKEHRELFWASFGITLITLFVMTCFETARRTVPTNYMLLAIFTAATSFTMGCVSSLYNPDLVFTAVGITAAVVFTLTIFAVLTTLDFTGCGGFLFVGCIILIIFGLVTMFFPSKIMTLVYASFGAILFSFYLIHDTQLLMGNHSQALSPEERFGRWLITLWVDYMLFFIFASTHMAVYFHIIYIEHMSGFALFFSLFGQMHILCNI